MDATAIPMGISPRLGVCQAELLGRGRGEATGNNRKTSRSRRGDLKDVLVQLDYRIRLCEWG